MNISSMLEKNSPLILAGLGVLGFVSATIMSAKATPAATQTLDDLGEEATQLEKVRAVAHIYAPTVGMLLLSTGCIVASNRIYKQRYVTLLALYSIGEKTLHRWQNAVVEEVGAKRAEKVREHYVAPTGTVPSNLILNENQVLFFDVYTGRYFKMDSVETVRRVINDLNEQLMADDFVAVNDLYFMLNLPPTQIGDNMGWRADDGIIKIVLDSFIKDDTPCVSISFEATPKGY